jgi:hypothetical protein
LGTSRDVGWVEGRNPTTQNLVDVGFNLVLSGKQATTQPAPLSHSFIDFVLISCAQNVTFQITLRKETFIINVLEIYFP